MQIDTRSEEQKKIDEDFKQDNEQAAAQAV